VDLHAWAVFVVLTHLRSRVDLQLLIIMTLMADLDAINNVLENPIFNWPENLLTLSLAMRTFLRLILLDDIPLIKLILPIL